MRLRPDRDETVTRPRDARDSRLRAGFLAGVTILVAGLAWVPDSDADIVNGLLELAFLGLLFHGLIDSWRLPLRARVAYRGILLLGAACVLRLPGRPSGDWFEIVPPAIAFGVLAVGFAVASWWPTGPMVSQPMLFPLPEGRWVVAQGGRWPLNHHRVVAEQAGALDLLRMGRNGSTNPEHGEAVESFPAYGSPVVAPCDGLVVSARGDLPDQALGQLMPQPPPGNHVLLRTGEEDILLAHFAPGSLAVEEGQSVTRGQMLGRVGNSGNTTEPHLHLHAERAGVGLQLRFDGIRGRLARSRRLSSS